MNGKITREINFFKFLINFCYNQYHTVHIHVHIYIYTLLTSSAWRDDKSRQCEKRFYNNYRYIEIEKILLNPASGAVKKILCGHITNQRTWSIIGLGEDYTPTRCEIPCASGAARLAIFVTPPPFP